MTKKTDAEIAEQKLNAFLVQRGYRIKRNSDLDTYDIYSTDDNQKLNSVGSIREAYEYCLKKIEMNIKYIGRAIDDWLGQ